MLRCPFCDSDLNDSQLQSGRCPTCGSVLAWQDDEPEPLPPRAARADQNAVSAKSADESADQTEPPDEKSPTDAAVAISQTYESAGPVSPPPQTPPESQEPPARHSTIRLNDAGTVDEDEIKKTFEAADHPEDADIYVTNEDEIQKTIQPVPLSGEEKHTLQKLWKNTISPRTRANMTIKTLEDLQEPQVRRRVPTRIVQDKHETPNDTADYRLLEIIGEGGVGVVYAAQQTSVDRTVALKTLRSDVSQDWEQRQKFLSEAIVTGDLDHPNIVPIYELGSGREGELFYAMKRVTGTPWCDVLFERSTEENLETLMKVADAIAFAHSRGVVHRDLKPENVMLGEFGEVQVMDWGIALPTPEFHRSDDILQSGSLGGTPAYMAPEMATGPVKRIGLFSDVYLLGGMLYEVVTGQTPHSGADVMECLHAAAANEIQPTHKSGELLNIALQAMATDPQDRFENVQSFQAAIREYQSHTESIVLSSRAEDDMRQADRSRDYQDYSRALFAFQESRALWDGNHRAVLGVSAAQLAYAQCALEKGDFDLGVSLLNDNEPSHQRVRVKLVAAQKERDARQLRLKKMRRTVVLSVVTLFVSVACALVFVLIKQQEAVEARDEALTEKARADEKAEVARKAEDKAKTESRRANSEATEANRQKGIANRERNFALQQKRQAEAAKRREEIAKLKVQYETYLARISLAAEKINGNAFGDARRLLEEYIDSPLRHWEWARLWYLCQASVADFPCKTPVDAVAFSPDGSEFATAGQDGVVRLWKTSLSQKTGSVPVPKSTFPSADSGLRVPIHSIAWTTHPGMKKGLIATAGDKGTVRLWNAETGQRHKELQGHKDTVNSVKFSSSGKWLVTASADHSAIVWNVNTEDFTRLRGHSWWVWDIAISQDETAIATAGQDSKIILWKVTKSDGKLTITEDKPLADYHEGPVYSVDFSFDGQRVVSGGFDNRVLVWKRSEAVAVDYDLRKEGKREKRPNWVVLRGHTGAVRSVRFSPDKAGQLILSCSDDNTVSVWNSGDGKLQRTLRGHGRYVRSCAFAPLAYEFQSENSSDRVVLSGSHDEHAKLWRTAGYKDVKVYGSRLLDGHEDEVLAAIYGPNGRYIATTGKDRTIRVWDRQAGRLIVADRSKHKYGEGHEYLASTLLFFRKGSAAGRRFVTGGMDGTIRVWQLDAGVEIATIPDAASSGAIALSPDERHLGVAGTARRRDDGEKDFPILIWPVSEITRKAADRNPEHMLSGHAAEVTAMAFSPDGRFLVSGDAGGVCFVWESKDGVWGKPRPLSRRSRHSKRITGIAFLDAKRVATSSNDNTVSIWNVLTGSVVTVSHADSVISMSVSANGKRIVSTNKAAMPVDTSRRFESDSVLRIIDSARPTASGAGMFTTIKGATISSVRFAPDGSRVLAMGDQGRVWEWTPGQTPRRVAVTSDDMWVADYTPDGQRVLTVGGRRAILWDWQRPGPEKKLMTFGPHATVSHLSFSPDGLRLASADVNGSVKIWNLKLQRAEQHLFADRSSAVIAAIFSPGDNRLLYTIDTTTIRRWRFDPASKSWKTFGKLIVIPVDQKAGGATAAAASLDGTWLVVGRAGGSSVVFDTLSGNKIGVLQARQGHTAAVRSVAVSADRRWIITGSDDTTAIVWERSPGGDLWDPIAVLKGHPAPVTSVAISRDRFRVLTGSEDKTAKIWDTRTLFQDAVATVGSATEIYRQQILDDLKAVQLALDSKSTTAAINDAAWKPRLVTRFEQLRTLSPPEPDGKITEFDVTRFKTVVKLLTEHLNADTTDMEENKMVKWNWKQLGKTSKLLQRLLAGPEPITEILTLRGHQRGVTSVTFSPDGGSVLTGSRDGTAVVWPAVNITPSIQGINGPLEFLQPEVGPAKQFPVADAAVVRDPDSPNFQGGSLVVELKSKDKVISGRLIFPRAVNPGSKIQSAITVANGIISYQRSGNTPPMMIGRLPQTTDGGRIEMRFNEKADSGAVTACLRAIGYQPVRVDLETFDVAIQFSLSDGTPESPKLVKRRELPTRRILIREPPEKISETESTAPDVNP